MHDSNRSLALILAAHAETHADRAMVEFIATGERLTYVEAWETACRLSQLLMSYGVVKKGRVALVMPNHWITYPLLVACNMREAVLIPVDPELHHDEMAGILRSADPVLTIHGDDVVLPKAQKKGRRLSFSALREVLSEHAAVDAAALTSLDHGAASAAVTLMIYTSGTTGGSKAVKLTAQNLVANATALAKRYEITEQDRFFCTLPTYHMNALMMTGMVPMTAGACIVLSDVLSFKNAKRYWKHLAEHQVTVCSLVPSIMALLSKLFPKGANAALPALRFGFCGAAPLSAEAWRTFEALFSLPIYQGYGLTETTCWAVSTPLGPERHYETVGTPLPGVCEVGIAAQVDADANTTSDGMAQGRPLSGEVLIRGAIVSPGYYQNKKLTKELHTAEGYYKTGDLGFFDGDGYLHITGRIKDIIIKNGANVPARDVDRMMMEHPSVLESKTFGLPDKLVGERICIACVVDPEKPVTESELRQWVHERLSHYMRPDVVELLGHLPKGAAGKIAVKSLRQILNGEMASDIVGSLDKRKYKRCKTAHLEQIQARVQASLREGKPLHFLTYWGCGGRGTFEKYEQQALDRLQEYMKSARRITAAAPTMTLIYTDVHVRNNRIPASRMEAYYAGVREYATRLGMDGILLSQIWEDAGLSVDQLRAETRSQAFLERWNALPLKQHLVEQAGKHLEQSEETEAAAQFYFMACTHESKAIAKRYPDAIFTTYNHPDFDFLLPTLPKVYLHSYKEGTSVKPWFVD